MSLRSTVSGVEAGVGRATRWLITCVTGAGVFAFTWLVAAKVLGLESGTAQAWAGVTFGLATSVLGWWAAAGGGRAPRAHPAPAAGPALPPGGEHIFLSYSHHNDADYATRLAAHIAAAGLPVWLDRKVVSGDRWHEAIRDKVDSCAATVVVMTPPAEASPWVNREIARAETNGKPIFPLLLAGSPFFRLADLQYEDVSGGGMPTDAFLDQLSRALGTSSSVPQPASATAKRPSSRGAHLAQALSQALSRWLRRWRIPVAVELVLTVVVAGTTALAWDRVTDRRSDPPRNVTGAAPIGTVTDYRSGVRAVAFSPDRRTLATGADTVILWDVTNPAAPKRIAVLTDHRSWVYAVAFSPDGHLLATGSSDATVIIWDITDPTAPSKVATLTGHPQYLGAVAFSPTGHTLATAKNKSMILWDVSYPPYPKEITALTGHTSDIFGLAFNRDGHVLASASVDKTVALWNVNDPATAARIGTLTGHSEGVLTAAFSPDGHLLATAGYDSTVILWNLTNPAAPKQIITLTGHSGRVDAVAFSPDSRTLATGGHDKTVILWNVAHPTRPTKITTLTAHTGYVTSVAFSRDGGTLATGSVDDTAILWTLKTTFAKP
jgi:WD40 repeat protein